MSQFNGGRILYSVDILENYYQDNSRKVGFVAEEAKQIIDIKNIWHILIGGKNISEIIDDIGHDIDFLILDTDHRLPGEVLDFIICFPYLSLNATIVLHDIALNFYYTIDNLASRQKCFASKVLFDTVCADKYMMPDIDGYASMSNISAFTLTNDTKKYIYDVFSCLTYTWSYIPNETLLTGYENIIKHHYDENCQYLFNQALKLQQHFAIFHMTKSLIILKY